MNDDSTGTDATDVAPKDKRLSVKRAWPLAVIGLGALAFFALDVNSYVTLENLRENRAVLEAFIKDNRIVAPLLFMAVYALMVAFSLPVGWVMTPTGGFLFGSVLGTGLSVVSATVGATALFVIAKTSVGDALRAKAGPWLDKLADGFQRDAFSYLLTLRLIPLFPFFVINLAPAFLGVRLNTYVVATFVGIIPASFVFTYFGVGLGSVFDKTLDSGEPFSAAHVLTPEIITALGGLGVLALLPVAYKMIKARRS